MRGRGADCDGRNQAHVARLAPRAPSASTAVTRPRVCRRTRVSDVVGHFLLRQAAEVAQLNDLCLPRIDAHQVVEGVIEEQDFKLDRQACGDSVMQGDTHSRALPLQCLAFARVDAQVDALIGTGIFRGVPALAASTPNGMVPAL